MSRFGENADRSSWFKSSYSTGQQGCVEVALTKAQTWVRDSKQPEGGNLRFDGDQWRSFLNSLRQS